MTGFVELLPPTATRTAAWYEARRQGIGGSEIAAVIGISPYLSAFNLWHRKAGSFGPHEEVDTPWMDWGRRLELAILDRWRDDHQDVWIETAGLCARVERPYQLATPDGLAYETATAGWRPDSPHRVPVAVIEAKTTDSWDGWGEPGTGDVPLWYRAQALWNLDVFGVDVAYMPVLSRGKDYREYVIYRNRAARGDLTFMRREAKRFMCTVRDGKAPLIDESDSTREALWLLHPGVKPYDVRVPDDLAEDYRWARGELRRVEAELDGLTNRLLELVGDGKRAVDSEGKTVVTRSVFERHDLDVKALRLKHPRIAKRFERVNTVQQVRAAPKRKGT